MHQQGSKENFKMRTNLKNTLKILILISICHIQNGFASTDFTSSSRAITMCPPGTAYVLQGVCLDTSLDSDTVLPFSSSNSCPTEYENIKGTGFCIKKELTSLTIVGKNYVVNAAGQQCFEGFTRPKNSRICIDKRLGLVITDNRLELIKVHNDSVSSAPNACPIGFYLPSDSKTQLCMSINIALQPRIKLRRLGLFSSGESCEERFIRPKPGQFCRPKKSLVSCGSADLPCDDSLGKTFLAVDDEEGGCCGSKNSTAIIFLPDYSRSSTQQSTALPTGGVDDIKSKPVVVCAPPARGQPLLCVDPSRHPILPITN